MEFPRIPVACIFGSPRSGTTILAKLIDSHPSVLYVHEPINKGRGTLKLHCAIDALRKKKDVGNDLLDSMRSELVERAADFLKPPFFRKDFIALRQTQGIAWAWKRATGGSSRLLLGPLNYRQVGLIVLKDGLSWFASPLADMLDARSLVVVRHPCAVVNSIIRGQRIGAMENVDRGQYWNAQCELVTKLGYARDDVFEMSNEEFEALRWVTDNYSIRDLVAHQRFKVIGYSRLVRHMEEVLDETFSWLGLSASSQSTGFARRASRPRTSWRGKLLGRKFAYFSVNPRAESLDVAWEKEMAPDAVTRVLKIASALPLDQF